MRPWVRATSSVWEYPVLAMRISDYASGMLDELISSGEVLWSGHCPG